MGQTTEQRFWARVDKDGPLPAAWNPAREGGCCWLWRGATYRSFNTRYGRVSVAGRLILVHRFAYELQHGPILDGLQIDHLCRITLCVNPAHMEPVTAKENTRRGVGSKTHCKYGHPFDTANTQIDANGYRNCRACHRRWSREHAARRRVV